jgi:hypothetical protein
MSFAKLEDCAGDEEEERKASCRFIVSSLKETSLSIR